MFGKPMAYYLRLQAPALVAITAVFLCTIPEFYPASQGGTPFPVDGKNWMHAVVHVIFAGALALPLVSWAVSSVLLVIARKVKSW